jgi:hypothetical protein
VRGGEGGLPLLSWGEWQDPGQNRLLAFVGEWLQKAVADVGELDVEEWSLTLCDLATGGSSAKRTVDF